MAAAPVMDRQADPLDSALLQQYTPGIQLIY
jgi:hypothetical protein